VVRRKLDSVIPRHIAVEQTALFAKYNYKIAAARLVTHLASVCIYVIYPREVFRFRKRLRRWPSPGMPSSFADKMFWRKVFDRNPLFTVVSDKLAVKQFARERAPDLPSPRTLWVGRRAEEIPSELFTRPIVIKANHGSSLLLLVHGGEVDRATLNETANRWLAVAHHRRMNEWGYAGIERRLLVEEMMLEEGKPVRKELKFHVIGGRVFLCNFIIDRGVKTRSCAFGRDGSRIGPIGIYGGAENEPLPDGYARAVQIAETVCAEFDYMRCDLYVVGHDIFLGELTVYGQGGYTNFKSERIMREMGERWDIRRSWFLRQTPGGPLGLYARALRCILDAPPN
jgi:hypothetical protein